VAVGWHLLPSKTQIIDLKKKGKVVKCSLNCLHEEICIFDIGFHINFEIDFVMDLCENSHWLFHIKKPFIWTSLYIVERIEKLLV
jgi:hypothetical protein